MKVLLLTNLFPTSADRARGVFMEQLAQALQRQCEVQVAVPLPWFPGGTLARCLSPRHAREFGGLASSMTWGEVPVHYLRYPMFPQLGRRWHRELMHLGIAHSVAQLHRRHRFDLINAHWLDPDGVVAARLARELGLPLVLSALGCDVNVYAHDAQRRAGILDAIARARVVTTVSAQLKDGLLREGVPAQQVTVIPNGVDHTVFHPRDRADCRRRLGLDAERALIVAVARLSPEKGLDVLLRALAGLGDAGRAVDLALVGDGPERQPLAALARQLGVAERVRFVGAVAHADVPWWLGAANLCCMPSLREGHPNAALEALACGRPLVASDVGALPDMVASGNGLVVPAGDAAALAEGLRSALRRDWSDRLVAATVARHSWDGAATAFRRTFETALA